jgi:flagellar biosynthetic protein FlhB
MAEEFDQQKTEAPTPRRREEARNEGRVAVSSELTGGLLLVTGAVTLTFGGETLVRGLLSAMRHYLSITGARDLDFERSHGLLTGFLFQSGGVLGIPLGVLVVAALGAGLMQAGFRMVPSLLSPRWERISPASGWGRLFSMAAVVRGAVACLKVALVALVAAWVLKGKASQILCFGDQGLATSAQQGWLIASRLALAVAATLALVGVADYLYQRWRHEQSLRMSRQELKDELKREEGDPQLRARIRKMQREMIKKQMFKQVPRATVVITNPTHLAVALRYERQRMSAPRVVAKGAGYVAERITALARRHAVPVVERKPLAQALYKSVQVGQEIPAVLYHTVAEVLAYIYRLRGLANV